MRQPETTEIGSGSTLSTLAHLCRRVSGLKVGDMSGSLRVVGLWKVARVLLRSARTRRLGMACCCIGLMSGEGASEGNVTETDLVHAEKWCVRDFCS